MDCSISNTIQRCIPICWGRVLPYPPEPMFYARNLHSWKCRCQEGRGIGNISPRAFRRRIIRVWPPSRLSSNRAWKTAARGAIYTVAYSTGIIKVKNISCEIEAFRRNSALYGIMVDGVPGLQGKESHARHALHGTTITSTGSLPWGYGSNIGYLVEHKPLDALTP